MRYVISPEGGLRKIKKTTLIEKIKHIMNRYETPETTLIDVVSEGVLCGSPTSSGTNESWGYEEI